jgi:hypothetical protein
MMKTFTLRNVALSLLMGLALSFQDIEAQQFRPGAFPVYQAPPTLPGIPGQTIILMPDGGTWTINPPAMPEGSPPPIYTPPDNYDNHNDCCTKHERRTRYGN